MNRYLSMCVVIATVDATAAVDVSRSERAVTGKEGKLLPAM